MLIVTSVKVANKKEIRDCQLVNYCPVTRILVTSSCGRLGGGWDSCCQLNLTQPQGTKFHHYIFFNKYSRPTIFFTTAWREMKSYPEWLTVLRESVNKSERFSRFLNLRMWETVSYLGQQWRSVKWKKTPHFAGEVTTKKQLYSPLKTKSNFRSYLFRYHLCLILFIFCKK